jgi:hypothetical protein
MADYKVTHRRVVFSASHADGDVDASNGQQVFEAGDVIEDPPESVLSAFGDRVEQVVYADESAPELPDLSQYTVDEVEELLADGDFDARLDDLEALEADGDNRQGVFDVIDERR